MTSETLESSDSKRVYEVGYLLSPSIPEDALQTEIAKLREIIESRNGKIIQEGTPELRTLAYTIVKEQNGVFTDFTSAYFCWIKFESNADQTPLIKEEFDKNQNVARFLIMKTSKEPSVSKRRAEEKTTDDGVKEEDDKNLPTAQDELDKSIDELVAQ